MKKRHILILITVIAAAALTIIPPLAVRIQNEQNHRGYTVALEFNNSMKLYKDGGFEDALKGYKQSGVTCGVIREVRHKIDTNKLDIAKKAGLDIALAVYGGAKKPAGYTEYLDEIIDKYDVKYIMPKMAKGSTEYPLNLDTLIDKYDLTLILSENSNQLSNEMPKGITANMESANGRIMRGYETLRKPGITVSGKSDSSELLYYQIINSVRDRNTEFIFVNQITDEGENPYKAAKLTQNSIKRACKWLDSHGYDEGREPNLSLYHRKSKKSLAGGALIGVLMGLVMLNMILKRSYFLLDALMYAASLLAFAITYLLPDSILMYFPTLYALVSSCFCFTLCIWTADRINSKAYTAKIFLTVFVSLTACACVLCAMLSGTDYYLNYSMFHGVKASLLMPMVYGLIVSAIFIFGFKPVSLGEIRSLLKDKIKAVRIYHIAIIALVLAAAGIYVMRSGNAKITNGENAVRNVIAALTGARPRTKEFLIGWPALALFAYYGKHRFSRIAKWIFASASTLIFASVINTFCHVFTDFSTSFLRTVYGLVFSLPFIAVVLIVNKIVIKKICKK